MPTKLQEYQARLNESTEKLWKDPDNYKSLLRTSSRLYKYSFKDQVLIYSQRPDAVACAEYDTWGREDITNRFVKRGSKGIALIADDNGKARLRYVFDFSDTGARDERSKTPFFWSVTPENENAVLENLRTNATSLDTAIIEKASEIARSCSGDFMRELMRNVKGTFLDELDEFNVRSRFEGMLTTSIAYTVLIRCRYEADAYFTEDDFRGLHEFNSIETMSVLGTATSEMSEQILRNIERTLKIERSKENDRGITENNGRERNPLRSGREDADLSSRLGNSGAEGNRQVRTAQKDVSDEQQTVYVSDNAPERDSEQPLGGDRRNSEKEALGASPEDGTGSGSDRGTESDRPDGLGGTYEHDKGSGGGNDFQRTDLQLNTDEAVLEETSDTAFSMSAETILAILSSYDEMNVSKSEVLDYFLEHESSEERAEFIKAAYGHRAVEFKIDDDVVGYKKSGDGLEVWQNGTENSVKFTWDDVQAVVADLIDRHEFIEAPEYFDVEPEIEEVGGYNEPMQLSLFGDFDNEPVVFTEPTAAVAPSVTQDMIDYMLRAGSNEPHSLERIVAHYEKNKGGESNAEFLRKEFGTDGRGFQYESSDGLKTSLLSAWYDKDGIELATGKTAHNRFSGVTMTWEQAAERIGELLAEGRYATQDILDKAEPYARKQLADKLWYLHQDVEVPYFIPDYFFEGGFPTSTEKIAEALQGEKPVQEFIDGMTDLIGQYEADRDVLRFHFHNLLEMLEGLKDRQLPLEKFVAAHDFAFNPKFFITEDEKDKLICSGSNVSGGKFRIQKFFKEHHSQQEKIAFLKNEYGIGGTGRAGYDTWHDSKGLVLKKGGISNPDAEVTMNWNEVANRVTRLVSQNRYITQDDIDRRIKSAKWTLKNTVPDDEYNKAMLEQAEKVLEEYGIKPEAEDNAEIAETPEAIEEVPERAENTEEIAEVDEAEEYDDEEFQLKVGDVIELDDGKFKITDIKDGIDGTRYELQDLTNTGWFPIFRNISEDELFENGFALVEEDPVMDASETVIDSTPAPNIADVPQLSKEKHDFVITDENLGTGGAKAKFRANVEAITLLNQLELENRLATPEEQEILSKYVGWGGLAQAFEENNSEWEKEFLELYTILSPEEYEQARASTLTAYYTSPTVINAIYEGLENLGFKGGNVLEPAMGVGNFFGTMPEEMRNSKLYGVELDSISGRIAKQLYQTADIQVTGFEKTAFPDNFFDVAVGNVPFGQFKLSEKRYDKLNLNIHDHFFAKSLDKVRAGGVIAFVTSQGTLDKANPQFRKYLAQRAELLGAIRLPNNAFKANAGTEVTSDIIFLKKRDKMLDIEPDWVKLGQTADGVPVNKYFEQHPEMILGEMKQGVEYSLYGNAEATACVPIEGADLKEQLKEAVKNIQGEIPEIEAAEVENGKVIESIPADPNVRNFSYTVVDDKIYFRENSRMNLVDLPKATEERIKGMVEIRDCVRTLIDYQLNEYGDSDIRNQQTKLNSLYDSFTQKHGLINSTANSRAFSEDSSYHLLSSLEILDENGELKRKADMFTKRTIKQKVEITSVDTASEALAVSISEKACVDMPFMERLTGKTEQQIYQDLEGVIFLNPTYGFGGATSEKYVTADEYLSGNIREKLEVARRSAELYPEDYSVNVKALENAMPKPLEASEIDVRLGATWIDTKTVKQFINETLQVPRYLQNMFEVNFSKYTSEWNIEGKNVDRSNVMENMTFGTPRKNAYSIIEDTLNLRDARVYDRVEQPDGKVVSVLNKKETMLAQEKQEAIKQAFKDWIFRAPDRREQLVNKYNELFNSSRPREYDGSHLSFSGTTPEIQLKPHQLNAIAHTIYGGNTLLAHQVGAGKTFEMVASAMESKRLGLCSKSLFVVPNHLTEQMGAEFLRLYPAANILVATKKDFEAKNRKRLCSKIATGDYDAVIIGHSQLEKIPISAERQERMIRRQIAEITEGISSLGKQHGNHFSVKQLEKTKRNLEAKLKKLTDSPKRDDVVTFEELGVDKLYIDEAHSFKNLFLYTKMRNVAGIQQTEAQKSADLYMKCQYLDELTGGKGTVFATGTPISNSMTELYTMMRYLQSDTLERMGLSNFDAWAANFGEAVTAIELAPEGTGYRAKTRFSKFFNLPELINLFKDAADIKTADMLNLPVPEAHFHNVVVKPSEMQKEMVSALSDRAKAIHDKAIDPTEDNMLKVTNDGRKIGLDQRLIDPLLPDEPESKVNACVNNVFDIYQKNDDKKSTQLVFCDFSTPKNDGSFNLYDDVRDKLIAKGVPKEEIVFIHDADTEVKKKELFAKVRSGKVRVLLGSTAKCGAGTNIQDKLIALHHLDCPWRPSDLEQREGRIIRQGNENKEVEVFRYMTEATFDAYLYQTIENKQRFISQIMSSKSPVRSCEDVDEATLSYAEVKALCAGNPLIKEKMDLDVSVTKLKVSKANHVSQQYRLEDSVRKTFPERIATIKQRIVAGESDLAHYKAQPKVAEGISPMIIGDKTYTDKEEAGKAILLACKGVKVKENLEIGSYKGFDMSLSYDSFSQEFHLDLQRELSYSVTLGTSELGNITRIENALDSIEKRVENSKEQLETVEAQLETAKSELGRPFPQEDELNEKLARLAELNTLLNIDDNAIENASMAAEKKADPVVADKKPEKAVLSDKKSSILGRIKDIKAMQTGSQKDKPPVKDKTSEIS